MKKFIDGIFSERTIGVFLRTVIKWRYIVVIVACLTTALSLWVDRGIGIDSSIMALLPKNTPSVERVDALEKKIGGQGDLIVMIESPSEKANVAYAEKILPELRKLGWVDRAGYRHDDSVFERKKLLFLDTTDLFEIRGRIDAYITRAKESYNPFVVDLVGSPSPASLDFSDIERKYAGARGYRKANISDDGTMLLIVIRPHGLTSDISFARKICADVKKVVAQFDNDATSEHIAVSVGGTYRNRLDEYETIIGDLKSGTLFAFLAIVAIIVLYFRRVTLMFCAVLPLVMSETWTFAITRCAIGDLNLITAFLIIILFGLGIDFGIHILNRYMLERRGGATHFDALMTSLQKSARASCTSALTIIASFYMLMFSDFLGFRHFGFIAGTGILLAYIAYMVLCPALLTIINDATRGLMIKPPVKDDTPGVSARVPGYPSVGRRPAAIGFAALGVMTAAAVWHMSKVEFEYDFRNLRSQVESTREFNRKASAVFKAARDPAAVLVRDTTDVRNIEKYLRDHDLLTETSPVGDMKSIRSVIPADQERKLAIIGEIRELVERNLGLVDPDRRKEIGAMSRLLVEAPLTIGEIPSDLVDLFLGLPGTQGQVVYLYQRKSLLDLHNAEEFSRAVGAMAINGKTYRAVSEPLVYLDLVNLLKRDSVIAVIGALLIIVAIIFLDLGNVRATLMVLTPLFAGLFWMFGLMHLFSIKLNLFNMVILPSILGLGIDAAVQVYHHLREEWGMPLGKLLIRIGGPNTLCTAINLIGFGGIVTACHPGLRSIGQVAIIGMSTCLVAALSILPVMMAFNKKRPTV